jgi:hypothetical protein
MSYCHRRVVVLVPVVALVLALALCDKIRHL